MDMNLNFTASTLEKAKAFLKETDCLGLYKILQNLKFLRTEKYKDFNPDLKDAFFDTEMGAKFTKVWGEGLKTYFQGIISESNKVEKSFAQRMVEGTGPFGLLLSKSSSAAPDVAKATEIAKKLDDLRKGDRIDLVEIAKMEGEIKDLRLQSVSASLSLTQQKEYLLQAEDKEAELIAYKIKDKEEELKLVKEM
jgi:hypothetical protein